MISGYFSGSKHTWSWGFIKTETRRRVFSPYHKKNKFFLHPFSEIVGWIWGGRQVKMVLPDSGNRIKGMKTSETACPPPLSLHTKTVGSRILNLCSREIGGKILALSASRYCWERGRPRRAAPYIISVIFHSTGSLTKLFTIQII